MLVWIDLETTGLEPETCDILEVGVLVTDNDLSEVAAQSWVLPYGLPRDAAGDITWGKTGIHAVVQEMHTKNGLWAECAAPETMRNFGSVASVHAQVASEILAFCRKWTGAKDGPMCGSTIAFDRGFLKHHMPTVEAHFSHRNLDVSVLGELAKLWAPEVWEKRPKAGGHRALPDIRASVELLRYWRAELPSVLR